MLQDQVHRIKWGFVPCDFEKYKFFKELNFRCLQDCIALTARDRWKRKDPQNRVIRKWIRNSNGQKVGHVIVGPRPEPIVKGLHRFQGDIERAYHLARYPLSSETESLAALMELEQIEKKLIGEI